MRFATLSCHSFIIFHLDFSLQMPRSHFNESLVQRPRDFKSNIRSVER